MTASDAPARLSAAIAGRYRIERELGQGGAAVVYLAHDLKHDRKVALKVLRADAARNVGAERFLREIRLAAKLTHPHILAMHDSGGADDLLFYVMPFVAGESLRDRLVREKQLPVADAVRIAAEVAGALDYAHREGIVHRDIKPENIMLSEGHALVADFGIGKAMSGEKDNFTRLGMSVGTPAYMSPEQASGEPVDGRSDIYSLGCVLYEMLVGEQPFTGPTVQAVIAKRFAQAPADVAALRDGVPRPVARAVRKSLARSRVDRYDTAALFATSLSQVESHAANPAPPEKSLAVMPFVNQSGDADNQYFSDGLSEDLINALTALPGLQVASRSSAFRFRGSQLDIRDIGGQLDVACVLEGSVRRAGTRLRVTAQLVSVATGFQLWSERYDREMVDVFAIQDEIVASIVKALIPALLGAPATSVARPTGNLEAYELYLKGRYYWHQRSPTTIRVAIQCFEQAIALDPEYALAYCGLADSYGVYRPYGWVSTAESRPRAQAAVAKAMALDPSLPESNFSQAFYIFYFEHAWRAARPHFERAVALNPRSSLFQGYAGVFEATEGRADAARIYLDRSRELDPLSPFIHGLAASALNAVNRYAAAREAAERALELQPDYLLGIWQLGVAACGLGEHDRAIAAMERAVMLSRAPVFVGVLGYVYARAGRVEDARRLIGELEDRASRGEHVPAFSLLAIVTGLQDLPAIRVALAASLAEGVTPFGLRVTAGSALAEFRGDPGVARMLDDLLQVHAPGAGT